MSRIGTLYPTAPYHFGLVLDVLARYIHPATDVGYDGAYWRVLSIGDDLALIRVDNLGTITSPALGVDLVKSTGAVNHDFLLSQIGYIMGEDADMTGFYTCAKTDPTLWRIVEPLVGLRWLRTPTVFEALMTTVIEQQIAWTAAQKAQLWLVEWAGHRVHHDGRDFYAFPTPAQIADATVDALKPLKITFKRMNVMIDIAQQVVMGSLDLERLRELSMEDAYKALTAIKGIGHWTATWTLQRARGWHNYVGHNDVALQAAVNHYFYGDEGKISAEQVAETFAQYGDYAGSAANYTIMRWVLDRYAANSDG